MSQSYPYGGAEDGLEEGEVAGGAGACPPDEKWYRIYPEYEFNDIFGAPPSTVIT